MAGRERGSGVEGARVRVGCAGPTASHCQNFGLYSEGYGKPPESSRQRRGTT